MAGRTSGEAIRSSRPPSWSYGQPKQSPPHLGTLLASPASRHRRGAGRDAAISARSILAISSNTAEGCFRRGRPAMLVTRMPWRRRARRPRADFCLASPRRPLSTTRRRSRRPARCASGTYSFRHGVVAYSSSSKPFAPLRRSLDLRTGWHRDYAGP